MIEIHVDTEAFTRLERSLMALAGRQTRYATAQALNDCARAASVAVNRAMPTVFDRPTRFTDRAAVAPRALAATPDRLASTVTVQPIQAKYLRAEELGGARSPADNTRKPASALLLPGKTLPLDQYGGIPAGAVARLRNQAGADQRRRAAGKPPKLPAAQRALLKNLGKEKGWSARFTRGVIRGAAASRGDADTVAFLPAGAPGNKARIGGYFRRLAGRHLTRLTAFEPETRYHPRLGYHARVEATVAATWPQAMLTRLLAAIATAR